MDGKPGQPDCRCAQAIWPECIELPDHAIGARQHPGPEPVGRRPQSRHAGWQSDFGVDGQPDARLAIRHSGRQPGHAELHGDAGAYAGEPVQQRDAHPDRAHRARCILRSDDANRHRRNVAPCPHEKTQGRPKFSHPPWGA